MCGECNTKIVKAKYPYTFKRVCINCNKYTLHKVEITDTSVKINNGK